ncbi:MAG: hypothetical protein KDD35_11785, partial [Bdellovibrionales bacterium]|nr:hypothetical protein [Bdellovibrionales bacterium]
MSKLKLFSSKLLLIFMVLVGFELGVRTVLFVIWGYGKVDYFPHFMESQYLVQTSLSGLSYSSHPFFGFANNESFRGVEELLRYPKDENQFVLGIAGGHFAHRLFQEINGSTNARSDMAQKLNLDPIMKLVVVNLAHNFYKQPQTFLSLLRYTQRLDYVLILDGIDGFFSHKLTAAVPLYFPHPLVYPYPNQIKSSVSYYLSRFLGHGVLGFRRLLLGSKSLVKSGIGFGIWLCASKLVLPLSLQLKERAFYDPSQ